MDSSAVAISLCYSGRLHPWLMPFAVQLDHRKKPLSCCLSSWRVTVCDCHGEKEKIDDNHRGRLGLLSHSSTLCAAQQLGEGS